ncbi:hypothetical protein [Paraburkholderia sp. SIMBA_054]|uniref:hypothetical protein n=1 Tax=Paraburkholderia sp. SIMBA_054 TaxID=3085795 RepID=UPI0039799C3A
MDVWTAIEYTGSALGMIGATTNSYGQRWAPFTWPVWLASNALLVCLAAFRHEWGLCAMQSYYTFTSINGLRLSRRDRAVKAVELASDETAGKVHLSTTHTNLEKH